MGKVRPQYLAFNAGEFDSDTLARADLEIYARGAEMMENIMPMVQGGMKKMPGTQFIGDVTELGDPVLLRPFVFNESDTAVLQLSDLALQFIIDDGYLQTGGSDATIGAWSDQSAAPAAGGAPAPGPGSGDIETFDIDFDLGDLYA